MLGLAWCSMPPDPISSGKTAPERTSSAAGVSSYALHLCPQTAQTCQGSGSGDEEHYPDDPEAQAVADFARAEAAAEEERRELAADPGGSLESGPPPPDPEPVTESVPVEPTEEDKERHRLTHLPFQAWCPECVQGAGRAGCTAVRQTPGREDWSRWSKWTTPSIPEVPSKGRPQRMIACIFMLALSLGDRPAAAGRIDARIWRVGIQQCS